MDRSHDGTSRPNPRPFPLVLDFLLRVFLSFVLLSFFAKEVSIYSAKGYNSGSRPVLRFLPIPNLDPRLNNEADNLRTPFSSRPR